ncbi:MAG: prepilin peptidase [Campylobacterota bacterium]|nr:prepilin peptidase [Campylobacterota bacterium]
MTLLVIYFIFGAVVGSFLNVVIYRLPRDENIAYPSSHCTTCNHKLKFYHNVPIFSWLFLRGKCAFCGAKISFQYPLIEILAGVISATILYKFGLSTVSVLLAGSFLTLLALSAIDFKYKMVPDSLNLLALTLAIASAYSLVMGIENLKNALLFAGGFSLLRFYVSYIIKREALGEADIMIAATMGAILGIKLGLFAIFLSAVLALPVMLYVRREDDEESHEVPFIPFLALATLLTLIFDAQIYNYLESLYG